MSEKILRETGRPVLEPASTIDSMTLRRLRDQLHALAPPGLFGQERSDSAAHMDARIRVLVDEQHATEGDELLTQWEADLGLPGCAGAATAQRRVAILARLHFIAGESAAYYKQLAACMGIDARIHFESAFEIGRDGMGDEIGDDTWRFVWHVVAPAKTPMQQRDLLQRTFRD